MERLTWKEIEEKYTQSWIAMKDVEFNGGTIQEATVVAVLSDDTIGHYTAVHADDNYIYDRTNPEESACLITAEGIKSKLR